MIGLSISLYDSIVKTRTEATMVVESFLLTGFHGSTKLIYRFVLNIGLRGKDYQPHYAPNKKKSNPKSIRESLYY